MNSLPKTVTRQRRICDLNTGPSAPESSTLTTRLPSHRKNITIRLTDDPGQPVGLQETIINVSLEQRSTL